MKKYLMYLGILLALFSTPQVANATIFYIDTSANTSFWTAPHIAVSGDNGSSWTTSGGTHLGDNIWKFDINQDNCTKIYFYNGTDQTKRNGDYTSNNNTYLWKVIKGACYVLNNGYYATSGNGSGTNGSSQIIENYIYTPPTTVFVYTFGGSAAEVEVPFTKNGDVYSITNFTALNGKSTWTNIPHYYNLYFSVRSGDVSYGTSDWFNPSDNNSSRTLTQESNDGKIWFDFGKETTPFDVSFDLNSKILTFTKVEVADPNLFEIQPGDMYLVGNHLNNWRSTPEYRLVEKVPGSGEYVLEDFLIVKNAEFVVRKWSDNNNYTDYVVKPDGTTWDYYAGNFGNTNFPKDSYQTMQSDNTAKHMKWCSGSTLFSVRVKVDVSGNPSQFKLEPNFYYPSREAGWPEGTTDVKGKKPVFGIPWLSLLGDNLKQDYSASTPNNGRQFGSGNNVATCVGNANNGWEESWVQTYNGKPVYYKTVPGKDNKGEQNGDVLYNTIWPPRENIEFAGGRTSNAVSFKPDRGGVFGKKMTRDEAIAELKGKETTAKFVKDYDNGNVYGSETDIPDGATWTKYTTSNVTITGSFKLWSGWGGALVGDDPDESAKADDAGKTAALWNYHPNWGLGKYDGENKDKYVPVSSNNVYEAHVSQIGHNGDAGANMSYSQAATFRELNFYVARTDGGDLHYYFVARLDAGDPIVEISKTDAGGVKGTMKILNPDNNTTYKVTGYRLYLSDDGGATWGTPVQSEAFETSKTIEEFNTWAETNIHTSEANLPTGVYQYRLDVDYVRGVTSTGYSDQITIANGVKVNLAASQRTEGTDENLKYAFDVSLSGGIDAGTPEQIADKVDHYELTIEDEFSTLTYGSETVNYASGTTNYTIAKDANGKFPEVTVKDMAPGDHKFRLEAVFSADAGIDPAQSTAVTATVIVPATYLVFPTDAFGFNNSLGVASEADFFNQTVEDLRGAKNWVVAKGEIDAPAVTESVTGKYDVSYKVIYEDRILNGEIAASAGDKTEVNIDNLPYTGSLAEGSIGAAKYNFALITVYTLKTDTDKSKRYESERAKTEEQTLEASVFPAPREDNVERTVDNMDHITIFENYSERFYGLHSYWQDAFVALKLDNKPLNGGLIGSLAQETVNGITGIAPIEAGGNYAFGKLLSASNVAGLWYQSWTEIPSGCEHHTKITSLDKDAEGHVNPAAFFAGTGEPGHDPRNQYFCTVDHHNDLAAKGFGTVTEAEAREFFKASDVDSWMPSDVAKANDEMIWYKDGRVYRKVHHVNHEARYFGNGSKDEYEQHDATTWAFEYSQYQPIQAKLRYHYNVLTSAGSVTATAVTATPQGAPRRAMAKEPADGAVYGEVESGSSETFAFGSNVTKYDAATTGIGSLGDDGDNAPVEYYNLQGVKVDNPVPGNVYIFRQGSRSGKILIK